MADDQNSKSIFLRTPRANRRVVVTGMSALSPLGASLEKTWDQAIKGQSGVRPISLFDSSRLDVTIAGEVQDFDPNLYVPRKEIKRMDRFVHLALAGAQMALQDSGVEIDESMATRAGCILGVGMGGLPFLESQMRVLFERGPSRLSPFFIPIIIGNIAAGHVSILTGALNMNYIIASACASGAHAIGEAYNYIRYGKCDVMICGGTESVVCESAIGGFAAMKALSTRNTQPELASRPFDRDRDGFVLAEGAGILILEDYERAARRGAKIYGEVCGYGSSSDAFHITNPTPDGRGAGLAVTHALQDAELNPSDIDYVNAHGTSTPAGDLAETQAIKVAFGEHAKKLWISSTKSMTGHTLGAAGAIESVFALKSVETGIVPPTINLDNPSEGCDLDYCPLVAREKAIRYVANNSFGFGGTNACLIFGRIN
jgi:3-oxoacyl-[acyl-carrier-protein] synthase II